jgi:DNA mismatch endonuclease, patch repair protein
MKIAAIGRFTERRRVAVAWRVGRTSLYLLMADVMTAAQRSRCMSRIRGRDTKPEISLRSALWRRGLRFRKNARLSGKPDIMFPTERVVVFVDGCFWHRCPLHHTKPAANGHFWEQKLSGNVDRDRRTDAKLHADGWIVLRVWEHEVKDALDEITQRIYGCVVAERATPKVREVARDPGGEPARRALCSAGH